MNGIILAAGRGSRMGALTGNAPKCLTSLAGRSLFDWQISSLKSAGVESVGVVRGYLGNLLERSDLNYFENPRWEKTNMVRSLQAASPWLSQGACIVSYSDIVYSVETVRTLVKAKSDIAISYDPNWLGLWQRRFADPLSDAETFRCDRTGKLLEIGAKTNDLSAIQGQYMGLLKFTPQGWDAVESHLSKITPEVIDKLDMTSLLRGLLAKGVEIEATPASGGWYEVDNESDLRLYEREIQEGRSWLKA